MAWNDYRATWNFGSQRTQCRPYLGHLVMVANVMVNSEEDPAPMVAQRKNRTNPISMLLLQIRGASDRPKPPRGC